MGAFRRDPAILFFIIVFLLLFDGGFKCREDVE